MNEPKPTETRYVISKWQPIRCVRFDAVRGKKTVTVADHNALGFRSRLDVYEWDRLGRTPDEARALWLREKHANALLLRKEADRAEAEWNEARLTTGTIQIEEAK